MSNERDNMSTETIETIRFVLEEKLSKLHKVAMNLDKDRVNCSNVAAVEYLRGHAFGKADGFDEAAELVLKILSKNSNETEENDDEG
jgi:hypothetical protein